jgi:hypothetical protein
MRFLAKLTKIMTLKAFALKNLDQGHVLRGHSTTTLATSREKIASLIETVIFFKVSISVRSKAYILKGLLLVGCHCGDKNLLSRWIKVAERFKLLVSFEKSQ